LSSRCACARYGFVKKRLQSTELYCAEKLLYYARYGFVITVLELANTIPTLWQTTQDFMRQRPDLIPSSNLLDFVTDDDGGFNLCHFWSNFEIGDLRLWRSPAYEAYFRHLDAAGGFYYERWGDAPVHSLAAAMLLNKTQACDESLVCLGVGVSCRVPHGHGGGRRMCGESPCVQLWVAPVCALGAVPMCGESCACWLPSFCLLAE
jgi:Glycolipid 2-alpha-mannosyltransferase